MKLIHNQSISHTTSRYKLNNAPIFYILDIMTRAIYRFKREQLTLEM